MKKLLAISITSILLTACGGGSDGGSNHAVSPKPINQTNPTTTKLQINNPTIGQKLIFGNGSSVQADKVAGKKYYARYAYCDTLCSQGVNVGEMNFTIEKDGDNFKVSQNVNVDKFGKISFIQNGQGGIEPRYQELSKGSVGLSTSNLTLVDKTTNRYKLTLRPAMSVESKLPQSIDIDVYFDNTGVHLAGADEDYLFVAEQMATAPKGWGQTVNKNHVAGSWKSYEIKDESLTVSATATLNLQSNNIIQDASPLQVNGTKGSFHGYYTNRGSAFAFGFTDDNRPLKSDGSNYDDVDGLLLLAPNGNSGIGYDIYADKTILIFK